MKIRKASNTDKENILRLHIESIKILCSKHYTREQLNSWTSVLTPSVYDQALQEKEFLIAYESQENFLGMGILDIKNAEVSAIYVHPDAAGRGVGTELLNELEHLARNSNVHMISVRSTLNAKDFYAVHGYIERELTVHKLPNGSKLECVRMLKDLSTGAEHRC